MEIRKAENSDLEKIMEIYSFARRFMAEHGNPKQWGNTNWPPKSLIEYDIKNGDSYVCVDKGVVVGVFYYKVGKNVEPTYKSIKNGEWLGKDTYGVVHRIAADGSSKGVGKFCINWAYEQCHYLRIDTHGDNIVMQNLLKRLGFKECGIIYVEEDNDPRIAYEKL